MRELRDRVVAEVAKVVVGQDHVVDVLLAATTVGGHVLLEGVPGVAKTLLANAFARALGVDFRRVQFTPDMLPSDLTGTMTLRNTPSGADLVFRPGPVFTNLVLADEINRTPPKTQSALLEAMQERQVSVDGVPHPLPTPFLVVATQNPIEYEGTYPLPEGAARPLPGQGRRRVSEPRATRRRCCDSRTAASLRRRSSTCGRWSVPKSCAMPGTASTRSRSPTRSSPMSPRSCAAHAKFRASRSARARAAVHLLAAAKAAACMVDRSYVIPDDVQAVASAVLRHRLLIRPEAELERYTADDAIASTLAAVPVPR